MDNGLERQNLSIQVQLEKQSVVVEENDKDKMNKQESYKQELQEKKKLMKITQSRKIKLVSWTHYTTK